MQRRRRWWTSTLDGNNAVTCLNQVPVFSTCVSVSPLACLDVAGYARILTLNGCVRLPAVE